MRERLRVLQFASAILLALMWSFVPIGPARADCFDDLSNLVSNAPSQFGTAFDALSSHPECAAYAADDYFWAFAGAVTEGVASDQTIQNICKAIKAAGAAANTQFVQDKLAGTALAGLPGAVNYMACACTFATSVVGITQQVGQTASDCGKEIICSLPGFGGLKFCSDPTPPAWMYCSVPGGTLDQVWLRLPGGKSFDPDPAKSGLDHVFPGLYCQQHGSAYFTSCPDQDDGMACICPPPMSMQGVHDDGCVGYTCQGNPVGLICVCPNGTTDVALGACMCPFGGLVKDGQCSCPAPSTWNAKVGKCQCPGGQGLVDGQCQCTVSPVLPPPSVNLVLQDGKCGCPTDYFLWGGTYTNDDALHGVCACAIPNGDKCSCPAGEHPSTGNYTHEGKEYGRERCCKAKQGLKASNGNVENACGDCPNPSTCENNQIVIRTNTLSDGTCSYACGCPEGQTLRDGKCEMPPCPVWDNVRLQDGSCCLASQVTSCGLCCPGGQKPDTASSSCVASLTLPLLTPNSSISQPPTPSGAPQRRR